MNPQQVKLLEPNSPSLRLVNFEVWHSYGALL